MNTEVNKTDMAVNELAVIMRKYTVVNGAKNCL